MPSRQVLDMRHIDQNMTVTASILVSMLADQCAQNLHVQLKATINLRKSGDFFKFQLEKKNYDDLKVETMVPRIIVILALPKKEEIWLNVSVERLIIRRCAFWASLRGMPELPLGQESKTIAAPAVNKFDVNGLNKLMEMARTGTIT